MWGAVTKWENYDAGSKNDICHVQYGCSAGAYFLHMGIYMDSLTGDNYT